MSEAIDESTNAVKEEVIERNVLDPYTSPSLFIEAKPGLNINIDQITELGRVHVEKEDKLFVIITSSSGKVTTLDGEEAGVFMALVAEYRPMLVRKGTLELPSEAVLTGEEEESVIITP